MSSASVIAGSIVRTRRRVWAEQPPELFDRAIIDADGILVGTDAECKEGVDISSRASRSNLAALSMGSPPGWGDDSCMGSVDLQPGFHARELTHRGSTLPRGASRPSGCLGGFTE